MRGHVDVREIDAAAFPFRCETQNQRRVDVAFLMPSSAKPARSACPERCKARDLRRAPLKALNFAPGLAPILTGVPGNGGMAPGAQVHRVQLAGSRRQDDRLPDDLHPLRLQRDRDEARLAHQVSPATICSPRPCSSNINAASPRKVSRASSIVLPWS